MTSSEMFDADAGNVNINVNANATIDVYDGASNDTFNSSFGSSDQQVNPMGLAGIIATSIILGVMTLTTIVGKFKESFCVIIGF